MKESVKGLEQKKWKLKGSPVIILAAIIILIFTSREYFSFLEEQLFEERKSHMIEFTDKASEIVDSVIAFSWQQVYACEHILKNEEISSEEVLADLLASTTDFIDNRNSVVLAIDENGRYYASDRVTGRWQHNELLVQKRGDLQQLVGEIPHKAGHSYFIFMERLQMPIVIEGSKAAVTHLAVAEDIEVMRERISVKGFGEQCYTYLMNQNGRRLYRYTYSNNFIEGYNILNAFQNYRIINGGDYEYFVRELEQGRNTAVEFTFVDVYGKNQNWFVANAALSSENWQILLFVPSKVLGAESNLLLERTVLFFVIIFITVLLLTAVLILTTMAAKNNKRLIQQKEEANQLLKAAADEANSANRAKSDFLSHMSHDIRTPINGIMGMTDIALKNLGNSEKVQDCLNKISGSSHHLLGLVNDVLDMSRIESGKIEVNRENFDIRTCIDNCLSIISGQLITRDIKLIRETEVFEHPFLIGDQLRLRQVFINILGNSVKFTPDGGKIYFRGKEKECVDGRALFRFELEDTGIGMKEEFLPHLFEAFSQEDGGTRTTYKGTGLGMAITKKFIELMGGTIDVKSRLNEGTQFNIEVWIDIDSETKAEEEQTDVSVDLSGMKALVVEDIELNLEIVQCILEEEGVKVIPACNGQEAVNLFTDNPPGTFDIILMDIMMPVMDGITAAKTIRALASSSSSNRKDAALIPILAMTANAYEEDIRKTHEAGMNAHLSKPIDVDVLLKTLGSFYSPAKRKAQEVLSGMRILLADDVELNQEVAKAVLEEWDMDVTTVLNGQQAVDAFFDSPPGTFDAILMDLMMPVMDGVTAAETIRGLDRVDAQEIPIIAMTADVYEESIRKTTQAGMNGYLVKPLDKEEIQRILFELQVGKSEKKVKNEGEKA